jgi:hypothetical protein
VVELDDGLEAYYTARLWQLLPAVYRNADAVTLDAPGPLSELLARIGAEVAVVRRSIDRLWADQAIETCEEWAIPYMGDLLATNLVNNLDSRSQRLDVAKTIHYRRHKGTLQVLEELAGDVTGWTAHAVEGFRRLARERHGLDPALGATEGLTGLLTGTPMGGFADLRSSHGAALADTPFDESFHAADVRRGQGGVGHFGIPKLLVFLWRLRSFAVVGGTPVAVAGAPNHYAFDPTGREIQLFLPAPSPVDDFSAAWTPRREWQVPGPVTESLAAALSDTGADPPPPLRAPYPDAQVAPSWSVDGASVTSVWPERGRFAVADATGGPPQVDYQYGFAGTIGAGPYNRALLGDPPGVVGTETVVRGGSGLDSALGAARATATITVADSLTYPALGAAPAGIVSLLVRAGAVQRPVLRPTGPVGGPPWVFTGGPGAELVLDGLTVSGCDIVLRGAFDAIRITGCTFDPGTAGPGSPPLLSAVDGTPLAPTRLFIEADPDATGVASGIDQLAVDHSILGPIRTRLGGMVQTLTISDSIVQGLPESSGTVVYDPVMLAEGLLSGQATGGPTAPVYPVSAAVLAAIPGLATALEAFLSATPAVQQSGVPLAIINALDTLIVGPSIYNPGLFVGVPLSPETLALAGASTLDAAHRETLNRGLLEDAFPIALGPAAIAVADAQVQLSRVTVLGRVSASRLSSSDSILHDFTTVDAVADGCVRFTAYAAGSVIPQPYESAAIPARAPIFTSTALGSPGYAQLLEPADAAIVADGTGATHSIVTGAENGSEMGAFCAELAAVKEQGLLVKFTEFMPLGLAPVIVHVT